MTFPGYMTYTLYFLRSLLKTKQKQLSAMDNMFSSTPNLQVEAVTSNMVHMVFGDGASGRYLGLDEVMKVMMRLVPLLEKTTEFMYFPPTPTV